MLLLLGPRTPLLLATPASRTHLLHPVYTLLRMHLLLRFQVPQAQLRHHTDLVQHLLNRQLSRSRLALALGTPAPLFRKLHPKSPLKLPPQTSTAWSHLLPTASRLFRP